MGSAYVFERTGVIWTERAHLFASDGASFDNFGVSTSISADTILIGASKHDTPRGTDAGSAYVYTRGTDGNWTEQAQLVAVDGEPNDTFGWAVAIEGDRAVVGAVFDGTAAGPEAGSACVYERTGANWSERARLFASDGAPGDRFSRSLALSGNRVVVGTIRDDTSAGTDAGSAYVFELNCCVTDVDLSGAVDLTDLAVLLAHFGTLADALPSDGDVDGDGDVDLSDLSALLANFGTTCP